MTCCLRPALLPAFSATPQAAATHLSPNAQLPHPEPQAAPLFPQLLRRALQLVRECGCAGRSGCPACVQHTECGEYNAVLHKQAAAAVLAALVGEEEAAAGAAASDAAGGATAAQGRPAPECAQHGLNCNC